ncbi:MAG: class I SAM-dependent methyltransferase [bacterium]|nr:class I SAM-dependent methyltransferase [bacterium]
MFQEQDRKGTVPETGIPLVSDPYRNRAAPDFLAKAPEIYRDMSFLEGIITATGLQEGDQGKNIAEFMSGTGMVGQAIAKRFPGNTLWYVDTSETQLKTIPDQEHVVVHDVRIGLPSQLPELDGAVVRFGVKNLSKEEQQKFVSAIADRLADGGWLVVADMVSPEGMQSWHNEERRLKHELEGHDVERDGAGNMPYRQEWISLLEKAGFEVKVAAPFKSGVKTITWKESGQFVGDEAQQEDALRQMNRKLLDAPEDVRQAFNIREDGDLVRIDYPLLVFRAVKPAS